MLRDYSGMAYSKNILQNCSYHFAPRDESVVCMLELKLSREQMESEAELSCNYTLDNNGHQSRDKNDDGDDRGH